jgi:hypothetical protein
MPCSEGKRDRRHSTTAVEVWSRFFANLEIGEAVGAPIHPPWHSRAGDAI